MSALERIAETLKLDEGDRFKLRRIERILEESPEEARHFDADAVVDATLKVVRPRLRATIGDRTPAQYDRADSIVESIDRGIRKALGVGE